MSDENTAIVFSKQYRHVKFNTNMQYLFNKFLSVLCIGDAGGCKN